MLGHCAAGSEGEPRGADGGCVPEALFEGTGTVHEQSFDPDTLHAMSVAFDRVCAELGPAARTDHAKTAIAGKIIALAASGQHDPEALRAAVLASFKLGR